MVRAGVIWGVLVASLGAALYVAATSPLLEWREPVYIAAGFAGVLGLVLIVLQPMLAAGHLPGVSVRIGRRVHRWTGALLLMSVLVHVGGLWITSPPDVVDALLLRSATPFSIWGVAAMWALFAAALLITFKSRLTVRFWRTGHSVLVSVVVGGTVLHALQIDGTMGEVTKYLLSGLALAALARACWSLRVWRLWSYRRGASSLTPR